MAARSKVNDPRGRGSECLTDDVHFYHQFFVADKWTVCVKKNQSAPRPSMTNSSMSPP